MKNSKQKRSSCSKKSKNRLNMIKVKQSIKQIEKSLQKNFKLSKKAQPIIITSLQKHHLNGLFVHKETKSPQNQFFNQTKKLKTQQNPQNTVQKYFTHRDENKIRLNSNSKTKQKIRICSPKHLFHNEKTLIKRTTSKKSTENSSEHTLIQQLKQQNLYYQKKYTQSMQKLSKLSKQLNEERKVHQAQKVIYERKIYQLKYQIFLKQANIDTPPIGQQRQGHTETEFQPQAQNVINYQLYDFSQLKLLSNVSEEE